MSAHARVYMIAGAVAHLLPWGDSPSGCWPALCRRSPWPGDWLGTGSQSEEEQARRLPLCKPCWRATEGEP